MNGRGNEMKLSKLLQNVSVIECKNVDMDLEISSLAYHSAKVEQNGAFVCIKGYKTDGHKYLTSAVEHGAIVAIVETFQDIEIPQIKVEDSRIALATMGSNYYDHPSKKMTVIGITATNGKTTTAFMVDEVLKKAGKKTGIIGTVMIRSLNEVIPSVLTTPESLDLQKYMAMMVEQGVTHLTMEVSSSALELHRVHAVDFDFVCFNNISRDHIDLHGSFEDYFRIKSSLIRGMKPSAKAVINADDSLLHDLIQEKHNQVITYSVESNCGDLYCTQLDLSTGIASWKVVPNHSESELNLLSNEVDIALSVPGYHSVYNAMAAMELCLLCQIDIDMIRDGLQSFKGVERRFELIYDKEFKIIDDHFANTGNIRVTLETLKKMKYEQLHFLYAIRGSRGVVVNRENAEEICRGIQNLPLKTFIATKSVCHVTEKDVVTQEEVSVFEESMNHYNRTVPIYDDLEEAIAFILNEVKMGDVILLAGCQGMDSAGKMILQQLAKGKSQEEQKEIMKCVEHRVCGI